MNFVNLNLFLSLLILCWIKNINAQTTDKVCTESMLENMKTLYSKLALDIPENSEEETSYCNWDGITCDNTEDNNVIVLDLSGKLQPNTEDGKSVVIPRELSCLTSLQTIILSNNKIHNTFPAVLYDMQSLKKININNSELIGTVPTHLCYLKNLEELDLSNNFLYGEIPECLTRPENIQSINLMCNKLGSNVPRRIINSLPVVSINMDCNEDLVFPSNSNVSNDNSEATCANCPLSSSMGGVCTIGPLEGCNNSTYTLTEPALDECTVELTEVIPEECLTEMYGFCDNNDNDDNEQEEADSENQEPPDFCDRDMVDIVSSIYNTFNKDTLDVDENTTMADICNTHPEMECKDDVPTVIIIESLQNTDDVVNNIFPQEIACLTNIKTLVILLDDISLTFPQVICQLQGLEALIINSPGMYGRIPKCIGDLEALEALIIESSNMEGPLPDTIANLNNLKIFYIICMENGGEIPLDLYSIENLDVYLINSNFTENLQVEDLENNRTNIHIINDPEITCPDSLDILGTAKISIKGCDSYLLTTSDSGTNAINPDTGLFYICDNKTQSELLKIVYSKLNLTDWYTTNTSSGTENDNICMWKGVRCIGNDITLDFSNANISTIPDEIACLQNITSLILGDNPIQDVPEVICMLNELQYLSLENTDITTLPECIYNLPNLDLLNLCGVELSQDTSNINLEEEQNTSSNPTSTPSNLTTMEGKCCHVRPRTRCRRTSSP